MPITTSTTGIALPKEVSDEVWQKVQRASAVMNLAQPMELPENGEEVNVITGDPVASWVGEGDDIPASEGTYDNKYIKPYKLSVIVPFSNKFKRNIPGLYDQIVARVPLAMAQKFDATVFGNVAKPGENFDSIAGAATVDIETDTWKGVVDADTLIAEGDFVTSGWVFSPKGKNMILNARDDVNRPIFSQNPSDGAPGIILGAPTYFEKGVYKAASGGEKAVYGFAGDWTAAVYGILNGFNMDISKESTIKMPDGTLINLWQKDMFAVKIEFEAGFRTKFDDAFVKLIGA